MVQLIYNKDSRLGRLTAGEKRLVRVLQAKLEDDYWCWCNVPIGAPPRYPDCILLHPGRGVLILEVKDWKLDTIQRIDKWQVTLLTGGRPTKTANPLEQARQYVLKLVDQLQQDPALRHPTDHPHAGKLCCPFGYGVVLTNISRRQFESTDLGEVLPPERVICQDSRMAQPLRILAPIGMPGRRSVNHVSGTDSRAAYTRKPGLSLRSPLRSGIPSAERP